MMRYQITSYDLFLQMLKNQPEDDSCIVWPRAIMTNKPLQDYGTLRVPGRGRCLAHRLSYVTAIGPIPKGFDVCHRCDTPRCFRPSHLFLGTKSDNMQDMLKKGRGNKSKGVNRTFAKLNDERVREIRAAARDTSQTMLAAQFGVSQGLIWKVINGKAWGHVA